MAIHHMTRKSAMPEIEYWNLEVDNAADLIQIPNKWCSLCHPQSIWNEWICTNFNPKKLKIEIWFHGWNLIFNSPKYENWNPNYSFNFHLHRKWTEPKVHWLRRSCYVHRRTTTFCQAVSSQVDYYTSKVTAIVSMTLTAAYIQGADLSEPLVLFGIAIQEVPGKHSRLRPSAGSHSSQTLCAISLSYLDHLEIDGRRRLDSSSGCCHNSLHMSRRTISFSIVPQPILTLRTSSLTSRSPAYHCGHLNWVIGIVVAKWAFQSAHLPI